MTLLVGLLLGVELCEGAGVSVALTDGRLLALGDVLAELERDDDGVCD